MRLEPDKRRLFGERLRQACLAKYGREHGMATRLAEDMNISAQTASKWLRGLVTPDVDKWAELAVHLGVTAQWLAGATHEHPTTLRGVGQREAKLAGRAAKIIFPLVMRLKPEIEQGELDDLIQDAYSQLQAGRDPDAVSGEVAKKLL